MAKRDPLEDRLVVLIGGSGFLGTHVAQALLERGARLRIASRHPEKAFRLKPLANLGQIQFVRCDVNNPASIEAVMRGADAAAYLVGVFKGNLKALHTAGAGSAAKAAAEAGAGAFAYVSAIGANTDSESGYARTKALGEQAVLEAFPRATVLRPSVLFGEGDQFINMFAGLVSTMPVVPIFGADAKLQPLWVNDAAEALAAALADPASHGGKTYELAGPQVTTMGKLNRRIAEAQGRRCSFIEMPDAISAIFASLPGTPMNRDQWRMLQDGSIASGDLPGIERLGVQPRPLELFLDKWMVRYRRHGRFGAKPETVR